MRVIIPFSKLQQYRDLRGFERDELRRLSMEMLAPGLDAALAAGRRAFDADATVALDGFFRPLVNHAAGLRARADMAGSSAERAVLRLLEQVVEGTCILLRIDAEHGRELSPALDLVGASDEKRVQLTKRMWEPAAIPTRVLLEEVRREGNKMQFEALLHSLEKERMLLREMGGNAAEPLRSFVHLFECVIHQALITIGEAKYS